MTHFRQSSFLIVYVFTFEAVRFRRKYHANPTPKTVRRLQISSASISSVNIYRRSYYQAKQRRTFNNVRPKALFIAFINYQKHTLCSFLRSFVFGTPFTYLIGNLDRHTVYLVEPLTLDHNADKRFRTALADKYPAA